MQVSSILKPGADKLKPTTLTGRDIIIISLHPWYFTAGCNSKNIAQHLARHNRVLYLNFPIKRKAFFEKNPDAKIKEHISIIQNNADSLRQIDENLWQYYPKTLIESVNWIPSRSAFKIVNYLNNKRFAKDIKAAIERLNFKDYIVFNDNDIYNGYNLKNLLSPALYIYYIRDYLPGYSYWKKHTSYLEPELIRSSDLVLANSTALKDYTEKYNRNSYYIGQGCSLDQFNYSANPPVPDDILQDDRITIGYIGALDSDRLDEKILEVIASHSDKWKIVLVGPEDERFMQSKLHSFNNVYFLGRRPFEMLAGYVASFDVCINPQLNNEVTKGNYPLKIDEYLAMGKPVVATKTGAMKMFENYTYLAESQDEYPSLIEKAIREHSVEKANRAVAFATSHSWENCMVEMDKAVSKILAT